MEDKNFIPLKDDLSHFSHEVRKLKTTIDELAVKRYKGFEDWKKLSTEEKTRVCPNCRSSKMREMELPHFFKCEECGKRFIIKIK